MFCSVVEALKAYKAGEPIVVVDDEHRENEGDIVLAASLATQEKLNFCAKEGRGLICIAIDQTIATRLDLHKQRTNHLDPHHTAFLDSIDASLVHGTSTGISAGDRSITATLIADENSKPNDFIRPGHLFPLLAKNGGILERQGHTEASVELCKLTNLPNAAVICEIMDEDGQMMRRDGLFQFADKHSIKIISIHQLLEYVKSLQADAPIAEQNPNCRFFSESTLPTEYGNFKIAVFRNGQTSAEHTVLYLDNAKETTPLVRLHSECLTGDVFHSLKCDCGNQLKNSLLEITKRGHGYLVYLHGHEGRGIGIGNKIAAYALQAEGLDTFEANEKLGFHADARNYDDAIEILHYYHLQQVDLISNNPIKQKSLEDAGFIVSIQSLPSKENDFNSKYLNDKKNIGKHTIITEQ